MIKPFLIILIVLYSFFVQGKVDKVCEVKILVNSVSFVQAEEDQSIAINLTLYRLSNDKKCKKYKLGVSTGSSSSYDRKMYNGANGIKYNIYKDEKTSQVLKDLSDGDKKSYKKIDFRSNTSKRITIFAKMPNPFFYGTLTPGLYTDLVILNIEPSDKKTTGFSSASLSINLNIQSEISISLVDRGQKFNDNQSNYAIFYGVMASGQSKGLDLIVKSNSGYTLSVSSEGNGRMRHIEDQQYFVDYTFSVNNLYRSLVGSRSRPVEIFRSHSQSPDEGEVINIDVIIKSIERKRSGTYKDYIYINAISIN